MDAGQEESEEATIVVCDVCLDNAQGFVLRRDVFGVVASFLSQGSLLSLRLASKALLDLSNEVLVGRGLFRKLQVMDCTRSVPNLAAELPTFVANLHVLHLNNHLWGSKLEESDICAWILAVSRSVPSLRNFQVKGRWESYSGKMSGKIVNAICASSFAASLEHLELTCLDDPSVKALKLANFPKLTSLCLQRTLSSEKDPSLDLHALLSASTSLTSLSLNRFTLGPVDRHGDLLARFPRLLHLGFVEMMDRSGVRDLSQGLFLSRLIRQCQLKSVKWRYYPAEGFDATLLRDKDFCALEEMRVYLTFAEMETFLKTAHSLRILELDTLDSSLLGQSGIFPLLARFCPLLEELKLARHSPTNIYSALDVADSEMVGVEKWSRLRVLKCPAEPLSVAFLKALTVAHSPLTHIELKSTRETLDCLNDLLAQCSMLEHVSRVFFWRHHRCSCQLPQAPIF
jgi:hypothetical protein